jgi:cob(I)alamin adenosyltransferase
MRIYTRTGDDGTTGLFGGQRTSKADLRVEAYGAVDEASASIGYAVSLIEEAELRAQLEAIQHRLFGVGADLATPADSGRAATWVQRVPAEWVAELEGWIDGIEAQLEPLQAFILPGGAPAAAALHVARGVCRRAERRVVALTEQAEVGAELRAYLNRLSDYLFAAARLMNKRAGVDEIEWSRTD